MLGDIENVPLRDVWRDEAREFTPWLASEKGLSRLGEALGLELELAQMEAKAGRYKVDIIARITDDNGYVIIENQFGNTDHDHLGKLITYAASWDSSTVVWISENFTDEHRQALDWMNEHSPDLNFFGLQIELLRIGDSPPAPQFRIISSPNEWVKAVKAERNREVSELNLQQLAFWEDLRDYVRNLERDPLNVSRKPRPQHWYNVAIGRSGFRIAFTLNSRDERVGCEIYIQHDEAKTAFDILYEQASIIEEEFGYELDWQRLDERKASRIVIYRNGNFLDEQQRDELIEWLYDKAVRFHKTMGPLIRDLEL